MEAINKQTAGDKLHALRKHPGSLILFLLDGRAYSGSEFTVGNLMVWLVVAMTLWSGIDYFWKNRSALGLKEEAK